MLCACLYISMSNSIAEVLHAFHVSSCHYTRDNYEYYNYVSTVLYSYHYCACCMQAFHLQHCWSVSACCSRPHGATRLKLQMIAKAKRLVHCRDASMLAFMQTLPDTTPKQLVAPPKLQVVTCTPTSNHLSCTHVAFFCLADQGCCSCMVVEGFPV